MNFTDVETTTTRELMTPPTPPVSTLPASVSTNSTFSTNYSSLSSLVYTDAHIRKISILWKALYISIYFDLNKTVNELHYYLYDQYQFPIVGEFYTNNHYLLPMFALFAQQIHENDMLVLNTACYDRYQERHCKEVYKLMYDEENYHGEVNFDALYESNSGRILQKLIEKKQTDKNQETGMNDVNNSISTVTSNPSGNTSAGTIHFPLPLISQTFLFPVFCLLLEKNDSDSNDKSKKNSSSFLCVKRKSVYLIPLAKNQKMKKEEEEANNNNNITIRENTSSNSLSSESSENSLLLDIEASDTEDDSLYSVPLSTEPQRDNQVVQQEKQFLTIHSSSESEKEACEALLSFSKPDNNVIESQEMEAETGMRIIE
jgi:hypothetical protein